MVARAFNPGEQVFLQGERTPDFYGLVRGRFAKIRTRKSPREMGLTRALSQAELVEVIERPNMVFGEVDVFLQQPQEFSVFAIDPGELITLPPQEEGLLKVLKSTPGFGVETCMSFANRLMQKLRCFGRLAKEEEAIDRLITSSFQHFVAISHDIETLTAPNKDHHLLQMLRKEPAYTMAQGMPAHPPANKGSSVYSAVIRPPGDTSRVQSFPQGALICKKDTLGDRLYILVEGVIEIPLGNETIIQIARPGSVIGEIAVFLNLASRTPEVKRTADCICATPVRAIVLGLDQVEPYLSEHPQLLTDLLLAMAERTRETHMLIGIARKRLREKLFDRLRYTLEGFNSLAHALEPFSQNLAFQKPFSFTAHQSKQIFQRFKDCLTVIETPC